MLSLGIDDVVLKQRSGRFIQWYYKRPTVELQERVLTSQRVLSYCDYANEISKQVVEREINALKKRNLSKFILWLLVTFIISGILLTPCIIIGFDPDNENEFVSVISYIVGCMFLITSLCYCFLTDDGPGHVFCCSSDALPRRELFALPVVERFMYYLDKAWSPNGIRFAIMEQETVLNAYPHTYRHIVIKCVKPVIDKSKQNHQSIILLQRLNDMCDSKTVFKEKGNLI
eukprot:450521_1